MLGGGGWHCVKGQVTSAERAGSPGPPPPEGQMRHLGPEGGRGWGGEFWGSTFNQAGPIWEEAQQLGARWGAQV